MNSRTLLPLVIVGSALLFAITSTSPVTTSAQTDRPATRWEHLALSVDAGQAVGDAETSRQIVRLGNEGWELVDVTTFVKDGTTAKLVYCFKKPK